MFTGLTLGVGEIKKCLSQGEEVELAVEAAFDWDPPLVPGESIAVSGVCLTVTGLLGDRGFLAHASAETLKHSSLGRVKKVNLERALALGGRLGGHLVSGHTDGPATVLAVKKAGASLVFSFKVDPELGLLVVPKGSIAVDGVSLTVNQALTDSFSVNLIPHTAAVTTLGGLKPGDVVNLETDLIGKYVHRFLTAGKISGERPGGLSSEFLAKHGFF